MSKFNHAFDIAFSLSSNSPDGEDVTAEMLIEALEKKLEAFKADPEMILEAAGAPFDSYEEE